MTEIATGDMAEAVIEAGRTRIGEPFRNHFFPIDDCAGGSVTLNDCLTRGMDEHGYDCSGLVIASICEAAGICTADWPRQFRHLRQMDKILSSYRDPEPGDIRVYHWPPTETHKRIRHMGIFVDDDHTIHASNNKSQVVEGQVKGKLELLRTIPLSVMLEVPSKYGRPKQQVMST